jgi:flagellar hook assembly protein FlgD
VIKLLPSYPNPFNSSTTLAFALSESADVTITIYDILGHKVKQFKVGQCEAGVYDSQPGNNEAPIWDGRNENGQTVASGCYLSQLTTPQGQSSYKLLFIR